MKPPASVYDKTISTVFVVNVTETIKWLKNREVWGYIVIHYAFILNRFILPLGKCYLGDESQLVKNHKNCDYKLRIIVTISGKIVSVRSQRVL